jgi:hypothetical protein
MLLQETVQQTCDIDDHGVKVYSRVPASPPIGALHARHCVPSFVLNAERAFLLFCTIMNTPSRGWTGSSTSAIYPLQAVLCGLFRF